jgi:L-lactate dehydrogenase complex protein LldE
MGVVRYFAAALLVIRRRVLLFLSLFQMKVALFVPCYIDQFFPQVAKATLQLLIKAGVQPVVPRGQTCCGQPMANSGFEHLCNGTDSNFIRNFTGYDYVVSPSGSCVLHVKDHLRSERNPEEASAIRQGIFEVTEFLTDILNVEGIKARFPFRVGVHESCHGQRGLRLSSISECVEAPFSKPLRLLKLVQDIEVVSLSRPDECCGFGGTFSVFEETVSVKMGKDRVKDHTNHNVQFITGTDMSCLMHLDGILRRQKSNVKVIHMVEILNTEA